MMSSDNSTPEAHTTAPDQGTNEERENRPLRDFRAGESEHTCQHCESSVSANYARVRGDNDNVVHRCPNCTTLSALAHGLAAGLERHYHGRRV